MMRRQLWKCKQEGYSMGSLTPQTHRLELFVVKWLPAQSLFWSHNAKDVSRTLWSFLFRAIFDQRNNLLGPVFVCMLTFQETHHMIHILQRHGLGSTPTPQFSACTNNSDKSSKYSRLTSVSLRFTPDEIIFYGCDMSVPAFLYSPQVDLWIIHWERLDRENWTIKSTITADLSWRAATDKHHIQPTNWLTFNTF